MCEPDFTEPWSSDGDSVSSDSVSSSSDSEAKSSSGTVDHLSSGVTKGVRFLKRAGVFTREEVIEQAIDRWTSYLRLCGRAMTALRESMVETYVKQAVDARSARHPNSFTDLPSDIMKPGSSDSPSDSLQTYLGSNPRSHELRALRRFGRYSSRVENARRAAAMSKFAIMSTRLAPWQRSGGGHQSCKYRDPTTTTWESRCTRTCLPLLPYCAAHLVLSEDIPPPPSSSTPRGDGEVDGEASVNTNSGIVKPGKPARKGNMSKLRSNPDATNPSTSLCSKVSNVQFPPQFLFRKCGGGPNRDCLEPVIAWSPTSRCPQHADVDSVWPLDAKAEGATAAPQDDLQRPIIHPLLIQYLQKRRQYQDSN